ncbi:putative quinol monooxygenase [Tundrisphaera lichenicola]|uniref:putative quinol monooxygenase n=1 Tax=Tundrisphaera lichenicola TaxID=2029860 RepID=UPI003EBD99E1
MICLAVTFLIKPGLEDEAIGMFARLTEATLTEPGCRMYLAHRSVDDPRKFFLYEQYDDRAALDAHRASDHFARLATGGLFTLVESRTPELYEPLGD